MTIDLKYAAPLVLPFVILLLFRALCFVAGAEWSADIGRASAFVFLVLGGATGLIIIADTNISWPVRIGGRRHD